MAPESEVLLGAVVRSDAHIADNNDEEAQIRESATAPAAATPAAAAHCPAQGICVAVFTFALHTLSLGHAPPLAA